MIFPFEETPDGSTFILRQCLPHGWKFLTGVIGKCLGHKIENLDELNLFELQILYDMVKNEHLDFS